MIYRDDMINDIARKTGFPKYKTKIFLEAFMEQFEEYLVAGETIKLRGLFKVEPKVYKGYVGKRPKTQEEIWIPTRRRAKFTVSELLTKAMNETEGEQMEEK